MSNTPTLSERDPTTPRRTDEHHEITLTDQTNLLPFRKVVAVFLGLSLCVVVTNLDSVIAATALPAISSHFKAGSISSWVPSAYLLTSTAFQPMYGRFSDIFGRKAAICVAMIVFMIGCLASGFSRSIVELIAFRAIAGAGGGGIISMMQIVVSDIVSLRDRGKYQGIIGGVVSFGYAIGPLIGGALVQKVTWRWCFWINLPMSFCAICVVVFVLPLKPVQGDIRQKLLAVDYVGAGLTLIGCTLVILPLIWGGVTFPWTSATVLAPFMSGLFVVLLFCFWEWKGAKLPIVPMYIFKHITVTGVYITMFINGFIFFSSLFYLPQFFQVALGYSPIRSAVFLLPVLVSMTTGSTAAGNIVSRTGVYRPIVYISFTIWAIACGCISTITYRSPKAQLVGFMLMAGTGAGGTLQTTTVAAQASVSRKDMSVVTAVRNFIRLLGGTLGLALGSTIINNTLRTYMKTISLPSATVSTIVDDPTILNSGTTALESLGISSSVASDILLHGYTRGFRSVFLLHASLASLAVVVSVFMIKHKELIRGDEEALKAEAKRTGGAKGQYVDKLKETGPAPQEDLEKGKN